MWSSQLETSVAQEVESLIQRLVDLQAVVYSNMCQPVLYCSVGEQWEAWAFRFQINSI